jgi:hypothetical protein
VGLGGIDQLYTPYLVFGKYLKRRGKYNNEVFQQFIDPEKVYDTIK